MACNAHNLSTLSYSNGFTLWYYTTEDHYADVLAPGYFDNARDMLRTRDGMIVNASDTNTMLFVTHNNGISPVRVGRGA